jgi:spore coat polysaccharide biosynthesis protein SpsF
MDQSPKRKVVTIIQARMGSTRLPGKVLLDIEGKPMLHRDLDRNLEAKTVDEVVIATTVKPADDAIIESVSAYNHPRVSTYRGSEDDVLDRYYQAAKQAKADIVVRITSDCPLVDPDIIDQVIQLLLDDPSLDYAANVLGDLTYPRGLDVQACTFATMEKMWSVATEAEDREHVTLYLRKHPEEFKTAKIQSDVDLSTYRWTVDEEDDLRLVREIYKRLLSVNPHFRMKDVLALFEKEPELFNINHHVHQKLAQY